MRLYSYLIMVVTTGLLAGAVMRLPAVQSSQDRFLWNGVWSVMTGRGYQYTSPPTQWNDSDPFSDSEADATTVGGPIYLARPVAYVTYVGGAAAWIHYGSGLRLPDHAKHLNRLLVLLFHVAPFGGAIALYALWLRRKQFTESVQLISLTAFALGTYLCAMSVTLNAWHHTALAVLGALLAATPPSSASSPRIRSVGMAGSVFAICAVWAVALQPAVLPLMLYLALTFLDGDKKRVGMVIMSILAIAFGGLILAHWRLSAAAQSLGLEPQRLVSSPKPTGEFSLRLATLMATPVVVLGWGAVLAGLAGRKLRHCALLALAGAAITGALARNSVHSFSFLWLIPIGMLGLPEAAAPVWGRRRWRAAIIFLVFVSIGIVAWAIGGATHNGPSGPWAPLP